MKVAADLRMDGDLETIIDEGGTPNRKSGVKRNSSHMKRRLRAGDKDTKRGKVSSEWGAADRSQSEGTSRVGQRPKITSSNNLWRLKKR